MAGLLTGNKTASKAVRQDFLDGRVTLYAGDCLDVLAELPENSVDSVVTDPPYHLTSIVKRFGGEMPPRSEAAVGKHAYGRHATGFMGKTWDGGDVAFRVETWRAVLRVLKPGGYVLAFASTRGFGRMSVAIEDAGFNTHPLIAWVFGSGFPKATRIKADGYDGFRYGGQALKPAIEPIYMGQKPFSEENGTANILRHGTGAVNIDACRIGDFVNITPPGTDRFNARAHDLGYRPNAYGREGEASANRRYADEGATNFAATPGPRGGDAKGRWPANLIHDGSDEVLAAFPNAPGQQAAVHGSEPSASARHVFNGLEGRHSPRVPIGDSGSAARFFYTAKADAEDRIGSKHPTVKPLNLMAYLCRLVTPPGGTILDPFAGTGTTGEAAWREGFNAILIEREAEYQADIARRMDLATKPTKRAAVAKTKNNLLGAEGTPLFGGEAA